MLPYSTYQKSKANAVVIYTIHHLIVAMWSQLQTELPPATLIKYIEPFEGK
jgi:hypothetical protein